MSKSTPKTKPELLEGTNFILVYGATCTGKTMYINHLSRKLQAMGYKCDSGHTDAFLHEKQRSGDWIKKAFELARKKALESSRRDTEPYRFVFLHAVTHPLSLGVVFEDQMGGIDLLEALYGNASEFECGYLADKPKQGRTEEGVYNTL
jgi:hypothetical protein